MGGLLAATPASLFGGRLDPHEIPLAINGFLLVLAAIAATFLVSAPETTKSAEPLAPSPHLLRDIAPLLTNIVVAAIVVGAFEVGLSIKASNSGAQPMETGLLLAECTIFMSAAQVLLLLRFIKRLPVALLLASSWMCLFLGLLGTGLTASYLGHAVSTALFGLGGGFLPPLAARLIADRAEGQIGLAAGMQSAASQTGQLLGGAGAGMIATWFLSNWIFLGASALAILLFAFALLHPYRSLETDRPSDFLSLPSKRRPSP
jgi:MFS family permease